MHSSMYWHSLHLHVFITLVTTLVGKDSRFIILWNPPPLVMAPRVLCICERAVKRRQGGLTCRGCWRSCPKHTRFDWGPVPVEYIEQGMRLLHDRILQTDETQWYPKKDKYISQSLEIDYNLGDTNIKKQNRKNCLISRPTIHSTKNIIIICIWQNNVTSLTWNSEYNRYIFWWYHL